MISDGDLLAKATRFEFGEDLAVEKRGEGLWAVTFFGRSVVNRDLEREHEPLPSFRDDAFKERTRFSLQEAADIATRFHDKMASGDAQEGNHDR